MSFTVSVRVAPWKSMAEWYETPGSEKPSFEWYGWGFTAKVQGYDGLNYYTSSNFWFPYNEIKHNLTPNQIQVCDKIYQEFFPDDDERWFPTTLQKPTEFGYDSIYAWPATIQPYHDAFQQIEFDTLMAIFKETQDEETLHWQQSVFTQWKDLCGYCIENELGWEINVG